MVLRALVLVLLAASVLPAACGGSSASSPSRSPSPRSGEPVVMGFVFSWGLHRPKNVLDTIQGTFTKDMVLASPLTVPFTLDSHDIASIAGRLVAIDFWSYPSRYDSQGDGPRFEPPAGMQNTAVLTVVTDRGSKTVAWSGGYYASDSRARALRELAGSIIRLIESQPDYKRLPQPEGGYL